MPKMKLPQKERLLSVSSLSEDTLNTVIVKSNFNEISNNPKNHQKQKLTEKKSGVLNQYLDFEHICTVRSNFVIALNTLSFIEIVGYFFLFLSMP